MRSRVRAFVVLAIAIAGLAALSSIAGARARSAEVRDPERLAALVAMDDALARGDVAAAVRAWRQARELGLRSRGWRGPADAADAELRLAAATDRVHAFKPTTRELFLVALFRARAAGAMTGKFGWLPLRLKARWPSSPCSKRSSAANRNGQIMVAGLRPS